MDDKSSTLQLGGGGGIRPSFGDHSPQTSLTKKKIMALFHGLASPTFRLQETTTTK